MVELMPSWEERLDAMLTTRDISLRLPIGAERRIRAHMHRMNGEIVMSNEACEVFDLDEDFQFALISLVEQALDFSEHDAGVKYDHCTGIPVDNLDERPQE